MKDDLNSIKSSMAALGIKDNFALQIKIRGLGPAHAAILKDLKEKANAVIPADSISLSDLKKRQQEWNEVIIMLSKHPENLKITDSLRESVIRQNYDSEADKIKTSAENEQLKYKHRAGPMKQLVEDIKVEQASSTSKLSRMFGNSGTKPIDFAYPLYDPKQSSKEYKNQLANLESAYFLTSIKYFQSVLSMSNPSEYTKLVQRIEAANGITRLSPGFQTTSPFYKFVNQVKENPKFRPNPPAHHQRVNNAEFGQERPRIQPVRVIPVRPNIPVLDAMEPVTPIRKEGEFRRARK